MLVFITVVLVHHIHILLWGPVSLHVGVNCPGNISFHSPSLFFCPQTQGFPGAAKSLLSKPKTAQVQNKVLSGERLDPLGKQGLPRH